LVVVVVDRVQLDIQLRNTCQQFLLKTGIASWDIFEATSSDSLDRAMMHARVDSCQLVFTTIQKFLALSTSHARGADGRLRGLRAENGRDVKICVIADEAHRSHGSKQTEALHTTMASLTGVYVPSQAHSRHANANGSVNIHSDSAVQSSQLSYVGFTATPTEAALEMFGSLVDGGGALAPLHCYPLSDAVHDGCVHNVLSNFTCISPRISLRKGVMTVLSSSGKPLTSHVDINARISELSAEVPQVVRVKARHMHQHFMDVVLGSSVCASVSNRPFVPKAMV